MWFSTKRRGRWIIHLMWCQKWHRYLLVIYIGRSKEDIFLITFYGLYFSHHLHILKITILHTLDLCGQLSCTVSTPVFLTCGSSSCLYFCLLSLTISESSVWLIGIGNKESGKFTWVLLPLHFKQIAFFNLWKKNKKSFDRFWNRL